MNVLGATYANCDGRYKYTDDQVDWAPERPVFKHVTKDRYIFWNAGGLGWSIGKRAYLSSGSHWHRSKNSFISYGHFVKSFIDLQPKYSNQNITCLMNRWIRYRWAMARTMGRWYSCRVCRKPRRVFPRNFKQK